MTAMVDVKASGHVHFEGARGAREYRGGVAATVLTYTNESGNPADRVLEIVVGAEGNGAVVTTLSIHFEDEESFLEFVDHLRRAGDSATAEALDEQREFDLEDEAMSGAES